MVLRDPSASAHYSPPALLRLCNFAPLTLGSRSKQPTMAFKPTLIVVDMQNDFCPPVRLDLLLRPLERY